MKRHLIFRITIVVIGVLTLAPQALQATHLLQAGDPFPRLRFELPLSADERSYLGLPEAAATTPENHFSIADIDADLIVVEFLNRYCPTCQAQAPIMNAVYETITRKPEINYRIKFIGIGAGNNLDEVTSFKIEKQLPFPIFPDPDFTAYDAIGDPGGTPCILLVKKEDTRLTVVWSHVGFLSSKENLLKKITASIGEDGKTKQAKASTEGIPQAEARMLTLNLKEDEIRKRVTKSMLAGTDAGTVKLASLTKIMLPRNGSVYRGEILSSTQRNILYSKVISRKPTCDVCHGIHFIVTFDQKGTIIDFTPIHLTKYDNAEWDKHDIDSMKAKLLGRSLLQRKIYKPAVDAVSSATMSCALIYNSINRLEPVFRTLEQQEAK